MSAASQQQHQQQEQQQQRGRRREEASFEGLHPVAGIEGKIILYWTKYFEWNDFGVGIGQKPFIKAQCSGRAQNCLTTTDRRLLNHSHVVLFHARDLDADDLPPPGWRHPHQNFIFFNYESPVHTDLAKLRLHFNNYFNRTMTYRRDSDIVSLHPYGRIKCIDRSAEQQTLCHDFPIRSGLPQDSSKWPTPSLPSLDLSSKNRTAAWFVSNCRTDSRRELLVRNLSLYIPVDIYGDCHGGRKCQNRPECDRMLSRHYRFYLSFENSLCPDYVTEKLYRALAYDTVPVVFGGADYSRYLPVGSYIDARDFQSPKQLADHMKNLMVNDELYTKHFRWRGRYFVDSAPLDGWCQLCHLLDDVPKPKSYADIAAWWAGKTNNQSCSQPPASLVSPEILDETTPLDLYGSEYVRKLVNKVRQLVA